MSGRLEPKVEEAKPNASKSKTAKPETSAKPKVPVVEPKKDDDSEDDESDDEVTLFILWFNVYICYACAGNFNNILCYSHVCDLHKV